MSQENFSRSNRHFRHDFTEKSRREPFLVLIRNAFTEGFTCFEFNVKIKGKRWRARGGLRPELHDEKDAIDFAEEIWEEFESIVAESFQK